MSSTRDTITNPDQKQLNECLPEYLHYFNFNRLDVQQVKQDLVNKIKEAQNLLDTTPFVLDTEQGYDLGIAYLYALVAKKIGIYLAYKERNHELAKKYFTLSLQVNLLVAMQEHGMVEVADTETMLLFCKLVTDKTDKQGLILAVQNQIQKYKEFSKKQVFFPQQFQMVASGSAYLQSILAFQLHQQSMAADNFEERLNLGLSAHATLNTAINQLKPLAQTNRYSLIDLAEAYFLSGTMRYEQQDYPNAVIALHEATAAWEQFSRASHVHPSSFYTQQTLGVVLRSMQNYEGSVQLLNSTRSKQIEYFGTTDNLEVANSCFLLGETMEADDDFENAEREFNEALEIVRKLQLPDIIKKIELSLRRLTQRQLQAPDEKPDSPASLVLARQQQSDMLARRRSRLFSGSMSDSLMSESAKKDSPRPY
jgi:hypothetical protein